MMSRFVQFEGLVRFLGGNISTINGSRISHSASVKLLDYGIVTSLESNMTLLHPSNRCQMGSIGRTVAFEPNNSGNVYKPLALGKQMFIVEARGDSGFQPGGRYEKMNFHAPYLVTVFEFIGITDITFVHVENDEHGGQKLIDAIAQARFQIAKLTAA